MARTKITVSLSGHPPRRLVDPQAWRSLGGYSPPVPIAGGVKISDDEDNELDALTENGACSPEFAGALLDGGSPTPQLFGMNTGPSFSAAPGQLAEAEVVPAVRAGPNNICAPSELPSLDSVFGDGGAFTSIDGFGLADRKELWKWFKDLNMQQTSDLGTRQQLCDMLSFFLTSPVRFDRWFYIQLGRLQEPEIQ